MKQMKYVLAFSAALMVNTAFNAHAAVSDSHKAAAEDLLKVINTEQSMDKTINAIADASFRPLAGQPCTDGLQTKMKSFLVANLSFEKQKPFLIDLYSQVFTEDELKEVTEFYQTPLGQKFIKEMPRIAEMTMVQSQKQLAALKPEMDKVLQQHVKDNEACFKKQSKGSGK